ncbi:MAG: elongation factor Ts [Candidatus Pacebacteria bacterium]|nr:elongation factor Ts [Candidatus Paceibacterota bacterium]MCD8508140.1 elongation factor Ts [Candidatus Paceibacterota bacterium]MCD8527785.1 elongation factor Ts [Candidatus Paceibacterota bacterium]MCD8563776.1 elongation factor Ts [Candidatus Paceibacterota bacterium]
MNITTEDIKALRDATGVSVMQCKNALEEAEGDMEKAKLILRKLSAKAASKKADRELGAGIICSYIHSNNTVGTLVELNCETDFVANNSEFKALADNIAMHITAMQPRYISREEIKEESLAAAQALFAEEVAALTDKSEEVRAKILEGKLNDYLASQTLLEQPFVKNPDVTVGVLIEEAIQKLGEKVSVGRFVRYGLLEE